MALKHNKKRDVLLVHELLVRQLATALVERDVKMYSQTLAIVQKYFSPGQPLALEREAGEILVKTRGMSPEGSRKLLGETKSYVSELDARKIEIKKSNLIKEIHYAFGQGFFSKYHIPNYRVLASVQMCLDSGKKGRVPADMADLARLEDGLVKYMSSVEAPKASKPERVDSLVASLAMKKFQDKYSTSLVDGQKRVLRKYMDYAMTNDAKKFQNELIAEKKTLLEELKTARDNKLINDDKVMAERFNEALERLEKLELASLDESTKELMLYHKLISEVNSDE